MPIGDSTPTSRWPRTGRFVQTCRGTVPQYLENKVPVALKLSVAAHRFLNKICFNEGYLSGPKVCRSNLETPCIQRDKNKDFTVCCWCTRGRVIYFTNCITYQLCWRRYWNCPPSLPIHFWHLFIKFLMTCCSSPLSMLLISSWIFCFSSTRVHGFVLYTAELILQPSSHFTYITAHSLTLPLLHLCHSSFSNHSFTSPTSPGEPPMQGRA